MKISATIAGIESTFNTLRIQQTAIRGSMGPATLDNIDYWKSNEMFMKERVARYYGVEQYLPKKRDT